MGNLSCCGSDKDDAWKQQNKDQEENPAYKFANLARGGILIDAYNEEGPEKVKEIALNEMSEFFYHKNGDKHLISEGEFILWQRKLARHIAGEDDTEPVSIEKVKAEHVEDYFNKFKSPHYACWDLNKRGGVGETPFHLLFLMDSPVHFEVARILLKLYPNLALDVYEGEEYYGESALHIAVVIEDFESVQLLIEAGADANQRATGRFFLPEDQKKGYTGQTNYEGFAYYGEYPLAFAASLGNTDIYDYLLDHGADPNLQDSFGNTVIHMVVIADQCEMYRYAVRHHKFPAVTNIKNKQNLTPLTLACKMGRHAIFKEMLDFDSMEFWRFSTTMCSIHPLRTLDSIGPDGSTNWNSALMIIVDGEEDEHLEMLQGGVMRQLLIEKWKTFAMNRFLVRLFLAIFHLVLFSVAIYTRPDGTELLSYRGPIDGVRYTSEITVCLSCLATVFYEIMEITSQGFSSFFKNFIYKIKGDFSCTFVPLYVITIHERTHAPAQTVYLISCLLILACIPFRFTYQHRVEDILLILAAPCSWFFLLFFARGHILTGPFVTMIYKMIAGDLFRFGIIYIIFLIGFTQGFFFLFHDVQSDKPDVVKFFTLPETVLTLFQMTFGEFKYEVFSMSHYSPLTKIIFALFMILVPILLLNMLIAMMGNTYTQVISKSTKEWWKQWAKIVVVLERGISKKKLLEFQRSYSVKLSGGPPPEDGSPAKPEERALVVIKICNKSRAKQHKGAVFKWKTLGKEIIRQLRLRKWQSSGGEKPFELEESLRKGQLLSEDALGQLSSTVAQLAWEKDIDLTKGHAFVTDPDSISPRSPTGPMKTPVHAANVSAVKHRLHAPDSRSESDDIDPIRKRSLVYNRVSPLLSYKSEKDNASFSDISEDSVFKNSETDLAVQHTALSKPDEQSDPPPIISQQQSDRGSSSLCSTGHESPSHHVTMLTEQSSEFYFNADSTLAAEPRQEVKCLNYRSKRQKRRSHKNKRQIQQSERIKVNEIEIMNSNSNIRDQHNAAGSNSLVVNDVDPNAPFSTQLPVAANCWIEDNKKPKTKVTSKRIGGGGNDSSSSLLTLVESTESSKDSMV